MNSSRKQSRKCIIAFVDFVSVWGIYTLKYYNTVVAVKESKRAIPIKHNYIVEP